MCNKNSNASLVQHIDKLDRNELSCVGRDRSGVLDLQSQTVRPLQQRSQG